MIFVKYKYKDSDTIHGRQFYSKDDFLSWEESCKDEVVILEAFETNTMVGF